MGCVAGGKRVFSLKSVVGGCWLLVKGLLLLQVVSAFFFGLTGV